jgi:hypothetical protein
VYLRRMYLSFVVTHHVPTKQSSDRKVNNYGTTPSSTNSWMNMTITQTQQQPQQSLQHTLSSSTLLSAPIVAGFLYFSIVFGIAFVLGTIRVLILVPRIGDLYAVLTETPIILTVSWMSITWIVGTKQEQQQLQQHHDTTVVVQNRVVMGIAAFVFLMAAEWILSIVAFNKTSLEFWEDLTSSPAHIIGLLGQVAYGLIPVMEWWMISRTKHQPQISF